MKRQLYSDKYWLLGNGEEEEPFLNAPKNRITSEENKNSSEESPIEIKEKRNIDIDTAPPDITFDDPELERAFQGYLSSQEKNGRELSDYQVRLLRKKLGSLSDDMAEQLMIVEEATVQGWKSFYPVKKQPTKKKEKKTVKNTFNAFPQRDYDFDALERTLNE